MGKTQPPGTSIYFLCICPGTLHLQEKHIPPKFYSSSGWDSQPHPLKHNAEQGMENSAIQTIQLLKNKYIDSFLSANQTKFGKQVFQG